MYACIEPIVDSLLSHEQAGFRCGRSSTDQVTLLTQEIEDSFSAKKKAGTVFVDLTAAYDTAWHCKLSRILPDRHIVSFIMEIVRNRSAILTIGKAVHKAGYDVGKTASLKDQSWLPSILTSTPTTCLSQLPGSLFAQTTWP